MTQVVHVNPSLPCFCRQEAIKWRPGREWQDNHGDGHGADHGADHDGGGCGVLMKKIITLKWKKVLKNDNENDDDHHARWSSWLLW